MSHANDDLPSAADSLTADADAASRKVQDAVASVESFAADMAQRSADAYRSSNAVLASRIDPLPALLLGAAAGFLAGCAFAAGDRR